MNDYWFKPHRYAIAAPCAWEGWLSILAVGLLEILILKDFSPVARPLLFWSASASSMFMFVWLAWIKTDGDWRFGAKAKS